MRNGHHPHAHHVCVGAPLPPLPLSSSPRATWLAAPRCTEAQTSGAMMANAVRGVGERERVVVTRGHTRRAPRRGARTPLRPHARHAQREGPTIDGAECGSCARASDMRGHVAWTRACRSRASSAADVVTPASFLPAGHLARLSRGCFVHAPWSWTQREERRSSALPSLSTRTRRPWMALSHWTRHDCRGSPPAALPVERTWRRIAVAGAAAFAVDRERVHVENRWFPAGATTGHARVIVRPRCSASCVGRRACGVWKEGKAARKNPVSSRPRSKMARGRCIKSGSKIGGGRSRRSKNFGGATLPPCARFSVCFLVSACRAHNAARPLPPSRSHALPVYSPISEGLGREWRGGARLYI